MRLKLFISLCLFVFASACKDKSKSSQLIDGKFIIEQFYRTDSKESATKTAKQLKGKGFEINNGEFIYKNKSFKGFKFPEISCKPVNTIEMGFVKKNAYPLLFDTETLEMSAIFAKILKKDLDETIKVIILDCEAYILILDSEHFAYFNENKLILYKRNPYEE